MITKLILSDDTFAMLKEMRDVLQTQSYDETIRKLIQKHSLIKLRGAAKHTPAFTRHGET